MKSVDMTRCATLSSRDFMVGGTTLILLVILTVRIAVAYPNEPTGFGNYRWQTKVTEIPGLVERERFGEEAQYQAPSEALEFEGRKATEILYAFVRDSLEMVDVKIPIEKASELQEMLTRLTERYGEPSSRDGTSVRWTGTTTSIIVMIGSSGIVARFIGNRPGEARSGDVSEFNERWRTEWQRLLSSEPVPVAVERLKEWLDREGAGLLSSYRIEPSGEVIHLSFAGHGSYSVAASPIETWNELLREEAYSVREVAELLSTSPELLRGKDVRIKAVVTESAHGLGCRFSVRLIDPRDLALFEKQGNPQLTEAERQALRGMPFIFTYGTVPPRNLGKEIVLRGHFFNAGLKVCSEGLSRFVIAEGTA